MKVNNGRKSLQYADALRRLLIVAPLNLWPLQIKKLFYRSTTLEIKERLTVAVFLYGNGCDTDDVFHLVSHRLRDDAARRHLLSLTHSFLDQNLRKSFFYYDVNLEDVVRFDHTPYGNAGKRFMTRKMNSFSDFCKSHAVNFKMEEAFMHDCDIFDASFFFSHCYSG